MRPNARRLWCLIFLLVTITQARQGYLQPGDALRSDGELQPGNGNMVDSSFLQDASALRVVDSSIDDTTALSLPSFEDFLPPFTQQVVHPTMSMDSIHQTNTLVHEMHPYQETSSRAAEVQETVLQGHSSDASHQSTSIPVGQSTARFFLSLKKGANLRTVHQVKVVPLEPRIATVSTRLADGLASQKEVGAFLQGQLMQDQSAELQVDCRCHAAGRARFDVFVQLADGTAGERFVFDKTCRGDDFRGFDVGTTPAKSDVIEDGQVKWLPSHMPLIPYEQGELHLYVARNRQHSAGRRADASFQSPFVRIWDEDKSGSFVQAPKSTRSQQPVVEADLVSDLGIGDGRLASDGPTEVSVRFTCLRPSSAIVELVLVPRAAWDPFRPASVFFKKVCHGGFKQGFKVGTSKGGADLVENGLAASQLTEVGSHQALSRFFMQSSAADSGAAGAPPDGVKASLTCSDERNSNSGPALGAKLSLDAPQNMYSVAYHCHRAGTSLCTLSLRPGFWKPVEIKWLKRCGSAPRDIVVESSLFQSTAVFDEGQPEQMWTPSNPSISLSPDENVAVFTVHSKQKVPGVPQRDFLSQTAPVVHLSDSSVLDVIVSREGDSGAGRLVFITRHVCKQRGTVQVTVTLPHGKAASNAVDPLDQVAFAYRKVCSLPSGARTFSLLGMQTLTKWELWNGIPEFGRRTIIVAAIVLICLLALHEFGHKMLSRFIIKQMSEHIGPDFFGTDIEIKSMSFRPWTGLFVMKDFVIKNPKGFVSETLLEAEEVAVLTSPKKVLFSCGKVVHIRLLRLTNIKLHVEFSGYAGRSSNLAVVRQNAQKAHQEFKRKEELRKASGDVDSAFHICMERKLLDTLDHAELHKAVFSGIMATAEGPLIGGQLDLSDIKFNDFSNEFQAHGMRAIASELAHQFEKAIHQDVFGVGAAVTHGDSH